jgi:hypothetical protein
MTCDPVVDEVRAIREQLAAKFDFDIARIIADARARQAASGARIASFLTGKSFPEQSTHEDHRFEPAAGR